MSAIALPGSDAVTLSQELLGLARDLGAGERNQRLAGTVARIEEVDPRAITGDRARIAFWVNVYNATLLIELHSRPRSGTLLRHRRLFGRTGLRVGAHEYTLDVIEHGLLRGNRRPPYARRRLLRRSDRRLSAAPAHVDPRVHFALNCGARSCPPIRSYEADGLDRLLGVACRSYLTAEAAIDRDRASVVLPGLIKLYRRDFGSRQEQLDLLANCLPAADAAWLRRGVDEVRVRYSRFDWTMVGVERA